MDLVERTIREALKQAEGTAVRSQGLTWYTTLLKSTETPSLPDVKRYAAAFPGKYSAKKLNVLQYDAGRLISIEVSYKREKTSTRQPRGDTRRKKK